VRWPPGGRARPRLRYDSVTEPSWFEPLPERARPPQREDGLPAPDGSLPRRGAALPQREAGLAAAPLPQRTGPGPADVTLPQRTPAAPDGAGALPRRTTRVRRPGRHRSPHRLTLPSDAPALILGVPGSAYSASAATAVTVGSEAALSCQGAETRVGYLDGTEHTLREALELPPAGESQHELRAVVVPLLTAPHPGFDPVMAELAADAGVPVVVAGHLGPHPLLAEALHARLSEAGLARASRARGLSISTAADGILMLADRGEECMKVAAVTAVLLAGRLQVPVQPASLGDRRSAEAAITRLAEAGCASVAISPCIIGPETDAAELTAFCDATGLPQAAPLGAHPAIGQLVSMRYGAVLAGLQASAPPAGASG